LVYFPETFQFGPTILQEAPDRCCPLDADLVAAVWYSYCVAVLVYPWINNQSQAARGTSDLLGCCHAGVRNRGRFSAPQGWLAFLIQIFENIHHFLPLLVQCKQVIAQKGIALKGEKGSGQQPVKGLPLFLPTSCLPEFGFKLAVNQAN
jgi:hypothetical protein